jgi:hypothetical protein
MIADVKTYMAVYEAGRIEDYYINIANDFITAAARDGFDTACTAFGTEKIDIPAFPINYGNNSLMTTLPVDTVKQLSGAQTNEDFLVKAFALKDGELSEPLVLGKNIVVLKMKEETKLEDSVLESLEFMYPYYTTNFDQTAVSTYFMSSSKLENNLLDVYFKYFMN